MSIFLEVCLYAEKNGRWSYGLMIPDIASISLQSLTLIDLITIIVGYIILWAIILIPVYLAGKVLTAGKATFGEAMMATLLGPIVYAIVLLLVDFFLGSLVGQSASIWAYILAFIAWIWVFKASFKTNWLAGLGIAILAVVILVVLNIILGSFFGVAIPGSFFPTI
jgi:hypothetical protein